MSFKQVLSFEEQLAELDLFHSDNQQQKKSRSSYCISKKERLTRVNLADLGLSERTSNGSLSQIPFLMKKCFSANLK